MKPRLLVSGRSHFTTLFFSLHIDDVSLLDVFGVVSRVEARLSVLESACTPALTVFFTDFGELIPWRNEEGTSESLFESVVSGHTPVIVTLIARGNLESPLT